MCITFGNPSDPCCDDAPATPLSGVIWRYFRGQSVADYALLSDANWSTGTTGHPEVDCHCLYHHFQASRQTGVFNVLNPIRWSPMAPANDGGVFDCFRQTGETLFRSNPNSNGFVGLRRGFIPRGWHCRFFGDVAIPFSPPLPYFCTESTPPTGDYQEVNLRAIAPTVQPFNYVAGQKAFAVEVSVYAVNHFINGQSVRGVVVGDDLDIVANWMIRVRPEDFYEIDCWYRIGYTGVPSAPPDQAKGCAVIRTARVSNGSELVPTFGPFVDSVVPHHMRFENVDFSPMFNRDLQTYEITFAGHRGWSLAYGSNGPHKILNPVPGEPAGELSAAVSSDAVICNVENDSPVESFRMYWGFEIAFALITFRLEFGLPTRAALYRSTDTGGHYLTEAQTTDHGTLRLAPPGRFDAAGTTVFELVPWSLNPSLNEPFEDYRKESDGTTGPDPSIPSLVPRRIIATRVSAERD